MEIPINKNKPLIMHVDLNSCFATIEQQANPLLRGKPIGIIPYPGESSIIIAPSIEAKRYGIKTGMSVREAKMLYPGLITRLPDPAKYRDVHVKFSRIFKSYSPDVVPKSIDEAVLDFSGMENLNPDLIKIAMEIKKRMKEEIGEWILCSIGISTNRFLAKLAASLHKPDGLDIIDHSNLLDVYRKAKLLDLNGINVRYEARLNSAGIFTTIDFYNADLDTLKRQVFQSIVGYYWFLRLRGFEPDKVLFKTKSIGNDYALKIATDDMAELSKLLMKLSEKMGRRLRKHNFTAHGIHVGLIYRDGTYWHRGRMMEREMFTTDELYKKVLLVFNQQPERKPVSNIGISCYALEKKEYFQESMFDMDNKMEKIQTAMDEVNDRYGEYVLTPALMMGMKDTILDRVPFGSTKEIEDLYV